MSASPNPSVGKASWAGWLTFAAGETAYAVVWATGSQAELHGPGKWSALIGGASLLLTNAGRYLQSHAMIRSGVATAIETTGAALPTLEEELASGPSAPGGIPASALQSVPAGA